jgi:hypothetical protein
MAVQKAEAAFSSTEAHASQIRPTPQGADVSSAPGRFWTSWKLPAAVCVVLACFFFLECRAKPLWGDEIVTYDLSMARSWREFTSLASTSEFNPPIYYIINGEILRLFGTSEFSIRFQSLLWSLAFVVLLWKIGELYLSKYASFFALVMVTISSEFVYYVAEARPYTFLCFSVALTLMVSSKYAVRKHDKWNFIAIFATFSLLAYSHIFGVLYGGLILGGVAIASIRENRYWKAQAITSVAGLGTLALWLPMILPHASSTKSWIPVPSFGAGYRQLGMQIDYQPYMICLVCVCVIAVLRSRADLVSSPVSLNLGSRPMAILIAALACLLIVPLVFVESHLFRPLFWPRYFMGLLVAYFVAFGVLTTYLFTASGFSQIGYRRDTQVRQIRRELRWAVAGLFLVLSAWPVFHNGALYARGPTAAELMGTDEPIHWVKAPLVDTASLSRVPIVFTTKPFFSQVQYYTTRAGARDGRFLFVDHVEQLDTVQLARISRQVERSLGSKAIEKVLIFADLHTSIVSSTLTDGFQVARVGTATLPYLGDVATVYLFTMSENGSMAK